VVKNARSYTSTPPYAFMMWFSVKAQRQLCFYLHFTYLHVSFTNI